MNTTLAELTLKSVIYAKKGTIAYITLRRPKVLNTLNQRTWEELRKVFEAAQYDTAVHGVILTGAGERAFNVGTDIGELSELIAEKLSAFAQSVLDSIENLGKPVIAAVSGCAVGGWCETAMACTLRIAAENAEFGQPEVKFGLIPGAGGTQRLPRLVGRGSALQMILSGEMITAQEAYRIGLVNEVVPAAELISRAEVILKQILSNPLLAVKCTLEAVNKGLETGPAEGQVLEAALFGLCAGAEDRGESTE